MDGEIVSGTIDLLLWIFDFGVEVNGFGKKYYKRTGKQCNKN